jgi:hypothetical protein
MFFLFVQLSFDETKFGNNAEHLRLFHIRIVG